jgi:hypothetical protein
MNAMMAEILNVDNIPLSREYRGMLGFGNIRSTGAAFSFLGLFLLISPRISPSQSLPPDPAVTAFEQHAASLYETLGLQKRGLEFACFRYALIGYFNLKGEGAIKKEGIISIIDFRKSCNERRFYTIDLAKRKLIYHTFVAHGKGSGNLYARRFSNKTGSFQSSIGFFVTGKTYDGEYGYSLYLFGMEEGFNDRARARRIVVHGAYYVGSDALARDGKIGQTMGCPALPAGPHVAIINAIRGGTCLFQFYDDEKYLAQSIYLDIRGAAAQFAADFYPLAQFTKTVP